MVDGVFNPNLRGVNYTQLTGTSLTTDQKAQLKNEVVSGSILKDALSEAIDRSKSSGTEVSDQTRVWVPRELEGALDADGDGFVTLGHLKDYLGNNGFQAVQATGFAASPLSGNAEAERLMSDLANHIGQQKSVLPATEGGGLLAVDGQWFINGQNIPLEEAYYAVRINQLHNLESTIALSLTDIQDKNEDIRQANEFLTALRAFKPEDSETSRAKSERVSGLKTDLTTNASGESIYGFANQWKTIHGYDPFEKFVSTTPKGLEDVSQSIAYNTIDAWIESVKSRVSSFNSDNSILQIKMEKLNNQRSEVLEGLTSFTKSGSQVSSSIGRAL